MSSFQVGWYTVEKDTEYVNRGFDCAAWYEKIMVKAGKYPVMASEYQYDRREKRYTRQVKAIGIKLPGVVVEDDFTSQFCGVPIGKYDAKQNAGKESAIYLNPYTFSVAERIFNGEDGPIELLPEFKAVKAKFLSWLDGRPCKTHEIINITMTQTLGMMLLHDVVDFCRPSGRS